MTDAEKALNLQLPRNDADADTVRDYLKALLTTVLIEEEGFSGKRPFGNSGWINDIQAPIEEAGLFDGIGWDDVWLEVVEAL